MNRKPIVNAGVAIILMMSASQSVFAESALQAARKTGATQLAAEDIEVLLVGNTVKAESGEKEFYFHYSEDNILSGEMIGGRWSDVGYYGITDDDRICLSMSQDMGRLRCLTLMNLNGVVRKYDVDGKMSFELVEFQPGNHLR